jgi:hypothetical protein
MLVACGSPPQVLDINPQRGAVGVRSTENVRVRFDRPMNEASVATRFHVTPAVRGSLRWQSDHELLYQHTPFQPSAQYRVVLDAGYQDRQGNVNSLRHSWTFQTESPPALTGANPGSGDRDVDPATYIGLDFSHEMDLSTLRGAVSLAPSVPFDIRQDVTDPHRIVLAPMSLLDAQVGYSVTVTQDARDVDGNRLAAGGVVSFTTGDARPLRHWIGFTADSASAPGGGVWIVSDDGRYPRPLLRSQVSSFSWSPDGTRVLVRSPNGGWSDQTLDGRPTSLPIKGEWAGFLAPGQGYAYLDGGTLRILRPDGSVTDVASSVSEAAVSPSGSRLAFVVPGDPAPTQGSEVDAYDVDLGTRYRLQAETGRIDALAWAPDALGLAYRVDTGDPAQRQVRARMLRDGSSVTVATGDIGLPAWQADSRHVFFTAAVASPSGTLSKVFRLGVGDPPPRTLSLATALPSPTDLDIKQISPSADGHQLAFIAAAAGRPAVWLMNADGTGVTQLTTYDAERFPYSCSAVAWTPT